MWTYYFSRTTLDVQRSTSDCAKRKVITYEDYDVFEAYSPLCERNYTELCERNVILRFSADISEDVHDNNVSNTHYLDNEAANGLFVQSGVSPQTPTTLVLRFQTNVRIAEDVSAAAVTPPSLSTRPSVVFLSKGGHRKEAEEGLGRKRVDLRSLCSTSGTFFRQGSGHFMTNEDGTLTYNGGETNAANVTSETLFSDLKLSLAKICDLKQQTVTVKYFMPGNKRNLITVKNDKDVKRMIDFRGDALTTQVCFLRNRPGFVVFCPGTCP
ncbi:PB1 domain-containing protein [Tanacetum coccineum]